MRRRTIAEVEHYLVDITPPPAFGRIIAFDDRMTGLAIVLRCVPVRRIVATTDMAAGPAQAQMQPGRADFQTLLAAESAWRHIADRAGMGAFIGHHHLPVLMLIDRAVAACQDFIRVTGWVGNLVIHIEHEFFGLSGPSAQFRDRYGREARAIRGSQWKSTSPICERV